MIHVLLTAGNAGSGGWWMLVVGGREGRRNQIGRGAGGGAASPSRTYPYGIQPRRPELHLRGRRVSSHAATPKQFSANVPGVALVGHWRARREGPPRVACKSWSCSQLEMTIHLLRDVPALPATWEEPPGAGQSHFDFLRCVMF